MNDIMNMFYKCKKYFIFGKGKEKKSIRKKLL